MTKRIANRDHPPRFSVLLASRNEGDRLRKTADDILRHGPEDEIEIVIVDDASDDESTAFLSEPTHAAKPIRAVRNERHRGLIASRARAADLARGEYLAFLDAHCAVSPGWLEALAGKLSGIDGRGLVAPAIYKLRPDWTIDLESGGAAACTISSPFLDFSWTTPREVDDHRCACTIGGGAWMCRRDWYRHIGGLDREMVVWGLENIDVPLRTWAAGGWCLAAEDIRIGHLYNEKPTFLMSDVDYVYNKIRAAHNAFSSETFTRVMESLLYLAGFREALARVHAERETMAAFKDRFESIRERSDSWLIDTFRLPLHEAPSYHLAPRRLKPGGDLKAPRPSVSVVLPALKGPEASGQLRSSLDRTTYGNVEVLLSPAGEAPTDVAATSEADYLAFVPADAIDVDEHWIEELLLLAERRPRLLMVCPRTRWRDEGGPAPLLEDSFEEVWDWDAPGFTRQRTGEPPAKRPYQVLSCPDALLFVNRRALLSLGGFDPTVTGRLPVLDLAVRGWLAGHEIFCHPGVSVVRRASPADVVPPADLSLEYAGVLAAVKCFTSTRRERCRQRRTGAETLLRRHAAHIERCRSEFLLRSRFDDDWLFFKFNVEEAR